MKHAIVSNYPLADKWKEFLTSPGISTRHLWGLGEQEWCEREAVEQGISFLLQQITTSWVA